MSGGWNPVTGRDASGNRPGFAPAGAPTPTQGQPYIPHSGGPGHNFSLAPQYNGLLAYSMPPTYSQLSPSPYLMPMQGQGGGFHTQQTYAYQPNGTGNVLPRQMQPCPNIDSNMPAAQMTNSSGGVGCEPGYNYFFAAEHTKVHVFKSDTPPWQLPVNAQIPFVASHVPCDTKLADLLKGFGCTNSSAKRNRCYEIISGGNGKWYKGFSYGGDDKDKLKMAVKDVGWDGTRTGHPDGKPVVCLWFCKN